MSSPNLFIQEMWRTNMLRELVPLNTFPTNKIVKVSRKAKANFIRGLNITGTNSKSFWKDKGKQQYIPTLKDGENIVEDDKAALLNHYFSKCFNQSLPLNDEDILKFWQL